jgi:hypothetical protein
MVKTTVYLDENEAAALRRIAAATGRSQAAIIREAVSEATRVAEPRRLLSAGSGRGPSIAREADGILRAEMGRRKLRDQH